MTDNRNALAELSADLIDAMTAIAETGLIADRHVDAVNKSYRIIDELAKADFIYSANPVNNDRVKLRFEAFKKCRAIAEGGETE